MFKQFIDEAQNAQIYLLSSLAIFLIFFIVVTIMLFYMRKQHVEYMSDMPLHDTNSELLTGAEL
jgi:hypothetical protein